MGPDWWVDGYELAESLYDPAENDGRPWDDLTADEISDLVNEALFDVADSAASERKHG